MGWGGWVGVSGAKRSIALTDILDAMLETSFLVHAHILPATLETSFLAHTQGGKHVVL